MVDIACIIWSSHVNSDLAFLIGEIVIKRVSLEKGNLKFNRHPSLSHTSSGTRRRWPWRHTGGRGRPRGDRASAGFGVRTKRANRYPCHKSNNGSANAGV